MQANRSVTRRSFLARVAGGSLIVGAGLGLGSSGAAVQQKGEPASRRMVVDADPRDPARPPSTHGRMAPSPPHDRDSGPNSDAGGHGHATNGSEPTERFVICPGNPRCPS